jgi:hypothetical protein
MALMLVAVALWIRLPRAFRVGAAAATLTLAAAAAIVAVTDSRVADAVSELAAAV